MRNVGLDANAGCRRSVRDSNQEGAKVPQKKRPHQGDTERIEDQTPDDEVVQDWDPAGRGLRARWGGHVPKFHPAQEDDGCRRVWKEDLDRVCYDNPTPFFLGERTGTQLSGSCWISFEPGSSSKERKWGTDRKGLTSPARGLPLLPI